MGCPGKAVQMAVRSSRSLVPVGVVVIAMLLGVVGPVRADTASRLDPVCARRSGGCFDSSKRLRHAFAT